MMDIVSPASAAPRGYRPSDRFERNQGLRALAFGLSDFRRQANGFGVPQS